MGSRDGWIQRDGKAGGGWEDDVQMDRLTDARSGKVWREDWKGGQTDR